MFKCPNKNLPEWKELEKVVPEVAYTVWDMNNGYGIDKAPNGEPSILFKDLLQYHKGNREEAIKSKVIIYSNKFKTDDESNYFNLNSIDTSKVDIQVYDREKTLGFKNKALKISIKGQPAKGWFELVKDNEYGQFSVHFKTATEKTGVTTLSDGTEIQPSTKEERSILWQQLYNAIPNGATVSTWGSLSAEGLHAIDKLGNFNGMVKTGERQVIKKKTNDQVNIPIYTKNDNTAVDQNGEPIINSVLQQQSSIILLPDDFNHISEEDIRVLNNISNVYVDIQRGLKNRLNSVKKYSTKNPKVWSQLQSIIQKLSNSEVEQGILQFMQHIEESINESINFLNKPIDSINARQIRQLSQDYVGFYKPLVDDIVLLMDTTDIFKDFAEYATIQEQADLLQRQLTRVNNRFINILKQKGYKYIREYLKEQGMPSSMIQDTINWLDDPKHDSKMFMNWFGMATNSDNAVQQTIAKMLNDIKNSTERETMQIGIELTDKLNKVKEIYGNDIQKLLYEKLDDGTYSGFRVMPLKWGQMKANREKFLQDTATKLGIEKDEHGQYILPQDEDLQNRWFNAINRWYSKNVDRKYIPEYYSLRNKMLSLKTRDTINEIQGYIDNIVDSITINGVQFDNLLSDTEFAQLEELRRAKKQLSNIYNLDGSTKTGDDLIIAKELTAFNEEVSKHIKYTSDKERYEADRSKVVAKYGPNSKELRLWEKRNTGQRYTQEFYDMFDKLDTTSQNIQTDEYKELKRKRRAILAMYKDSQTNKIDVEKLSDSDRQQILQLDQDIADNYTTPTEKKEEAVKFSDFAEIAITDKYFEDAKRARDAGTAEYNNWYNKNHYENSRGYMKPASYYTELRPIEKLRAKYTETVPIGRYSKLDPSSDWFNHNWDENGPAIQPNKKIYDNSKAYKAITSKPELKELYDDIERIMNQANSFISFIEHSDSNKMPQIPARLMQVLGRRDSVLQKLKYIVEDVVITKADDLDFVEEFSTMPSGDPIKVIPTRYIKMLEDPNTISTDAVASVIQYYNMAVNYKNMSNKQDDIEMMLNLLKQLPIRTKKELKGPGSTNIYKQSQLLVDRLMYGRNKNPIVYNAFGKEINVGKTLDIIRNFVTKVNLSGNLWSIGTSFFTDVTYTTLEAKIGRYFDLEDLNFAKSEFYREFPNMMANIGNPVPNGKLPYLMMLNQVVKDNKELFDRLDQSQVLRSINQNFWFAGYTQSDYTVKSHTLLSIYHNYRFVDGQGFMSKQEYIDKYYPTNRKVGATNFKQLQITLYDAYVVKEDKTQVDDKYKDYVDEKLLNKVKNRIDIIARRIDGTIREVDKAGIHANSIASYLVLHRNFMVSALHDRFKRKQFNLDLGAMEEGYYRSTGKFLRNIISNRHFALSQLLADFDNMEEYEQYAVKRTLNELMLIAGSTAVAISLAALVDGDDDYDNWLMQSITYLAMRSAFEFRTMYNPFEFIALIKSPTAAFNWLDNVSSFINIINPAAYVGDRTPFTIIDRGVYKNMPVILKNIIKVTPFKSAFEAQDPKSKRNYLQNQLMNF